jgi:hypothetical protein
MTTAMQIGETARDRADSCRCFKTGAAVFLHNGRIVAHSTYRNTLRAAQMLARTNRDTSGFSEYECAGCARSTCSGSLLPAPFDRRLTKGYENDVRDVSRRSSRRLLGREAAKACGKPTVISANRPCSARVGLSPAHRLEALRKPARAAPWLPTMNQGHHSVSVILVRFGGLSGSKPRSRAACSMVA